MEQIYFYIDDDLDLGGKMMPHLPEAWFELFGSWEDNSSTKEIIQDIDQGYLVHAE